jgi:hypothetical protein
VILVNGGYLVTTFLSLIKPFTDKRTFEKFIVTNKPYKKLVNTLVIDPAEIPKDYGGKAQEIKTI